MNERDWAAVGHCISQRLAELEWTQHELAARSGVAKPADQHHPVTAKGFSDSPPPDTTVAWIRHTTET